MTNPNEPIILDESTADPSLANQEELSPVESQISTEPPVSGGEGLAKIANVLIEVAKHLDDIASERDRLKQELEDERNGRMSDKGSHTQALADAEAIHDEQIRMLKADIEKALSDE